MLPKNIYFEVEDTLNLPVARTHFSTIAGLLREKVK